MSNARAQVRQNMPKIHLVLISYWFQLLDLLAVTMIATLTMYPDLVQQESDIIANYLGIESNSNSTLAPENRTIWVIQNPLDCGKSQKLLLWEFLHVICFRFYIVVKNGSVFAPVA